MMGSVAFHNAWFCLPRARKLVPVLVVIIVLVAWTTLLGHGQEALTAVITAVLAVAAEELARAVIQYRLRTT